VGSSSTLSAKDARRALRANQIEGLRLLNVANLLPCHAQEDSICICRTYPYDVGQVDLGLLRRIDTLAVRAHAIDHKGLSGLLLLGSVDILAFGPAPVFVDSADVVYRWTNQTTNHRHQVAGSLTYLPPVLRAGDRVVLVNGPSLLRVLPLARATDDRDGELEVGGDGELQFVLTFLFETASVTWAPRFKIGWQGDVGLILGFKDGWEELAGYQTVK
jgi:hypothetical protein